MKRLATFGLGSLILFATASAWAANITESEANDGKSAANAGTLAPGETITGTSTGTSTSSPGDASADYFKVKTVAAPPAIYQYRLQLSSATLGQSGSIRGLTQSGGVINASSDASFQTSQAAASGALPARTVQWYGFGLQEEIYYRVVGTTTTTAPYTATLSRLAINPIVLSGTFREGNITIGRAAGNTADVDMWVYNGSFAALDGYGNDGQNSLTRSFGPGTYYVAFSNANTANNQASPADDSNRSSSVLDFPGAIANSSTSAFPNMGISITDSQGAREAAGAKNSAFDIVWYQFTVVGVNSACCFPNGSCQIAGLNACVAGGGVIQADGTTCQTANCPQPGACCKPDGSCEFVLASACQVLGGSYNGANIQCAAVSCPQPGACCLPDGTCRILFTPGCTALGGAYQGANVGCGTVAYTATPNLIVPDGGNASTTITITESLTISDLNVRFAMPGHTYLADLDVSLTHDGVTVNLWNDFCGGNNGIDVIFDDEGGPVICAEPTQGVYQTVGTPAGTLSQFDGQTTNGDWVLFVGDDAGADTGTVTEWALIFTDASVPFPCLVACCFGDGSCQDLLSSNCSQQGGTSLGAGAACAASPCPVACCFFNGSCTDLSTGACGTAGGTAQAPGSNCAGTTCPAPAGELCTNAMDIPNPLPYTANFDNNLYSPDAPGGDICNTAGATVMQNAIWLKWHSPSACEIRVTINPTIYDGVAAVYSGACDNLLYIACGDEPEPMVFNFQAEADTDYFFEVGDWGLAEGGGSTDFTIECLIPTGGCCVANNCSRTTQADCTAQSGNYLGDNVGCNSVANDPTTYTSTPNLPVPDSGQVTDVIDVPDSFAIGDVNIAVAIPDHTYVSDLRITIEHGGTTVLLLAATCPGNDGLNVVFDDAGAAIVCANPVTGTVVPTGAGAGPLSSFEGMDVGGAWTLTVADQVGADIGTLTEWSVIADATGPSPCDNTDPCAGTLRGDANCDGVVNNFDIGLFVAGLIDDLNQFTTLGGTQACFDRRACWGDLSHDGSFNNFDINPFVICITNLPPQGQPCP